VRKIADYVAKKVGDRLKELYRDDRKEYIRCWQDIGTFVKFGSLNDEKFKKQVEDILVFRTTYKPEPTDSQKPEDADDAWESSENIAGSFDQQGNYYTTLQEYLERNKQRHENRVFYCTEEAAQATYIELHKSQGLEVLFLDSFIDTHFISFLEREHSDVKFLRVDSEINEELIDKDSSKTEIVDPKTNKTRSEQIKELFEKSLNKPRLNIRTEALKSEDTPPAMVLLPEAMRRLQDMTALFQQQKAEFPEDHVLLINTSHPLIQNLANLSQGSIEGTESPSAELAKMICYHVYDLALMAQKGFDANAMKSFVERSNQVLTELTQRAV
jgi:molecular chaperone HtpG